MQVLDNLFHTTEYTLFSFLSIKEIALGSTIISNLVTETQSISQHRLTAVSTLCWLDCYLEYNESFQWNKHFHVCFVPVWFFPSQE